MNNSKFEQLLRSLAKSTSQEPLCEHPLFAGFESNDEVVAAFVEESLSSEQNNHVMKSMASNASLREQWLALKQMSHITSSKLSTQNKVLGNQSKVSRFNGINTWLPLAASIMFVVIISVDPFEEQPLYTNEASDPTLKITPVENAQAKNDQHSINKNSLVAQQHTPQRMASQSSVTQLKKASSVNSNKATSPAQWHQFLLGAQSLTQESNSDSSSPVEITHYVLGNATAKFVTEKCTRLNAINWHKKLIALTPLTFDLDAYTIPIQGTLSNEQVKATCQLAIDMMQTAKKSVKEAN